MPNNTALIILTGCAQTRTGQATSSIPETVPDSQKDGMIILDSLDPDKEPTSIQTVAETTDKSAEIGLKLKTVEQVIFEAESSDDLKPEMEQENERVNDQVNEQVNDSVEPDEAEDTAEQIMEIEVPEPELMDEHNDPDPESTDRSDLELLPETETEPEPEPESESTAVTEPESEMDTEPETVITQPESETDSEPESEPEPEPETVPEFESAFDIDYWVSYAYSLAAGKGLNLNPSATDCWDNPITANADCIYLERDLNNRLDRYAGDEGITDVWIWYEDLGEGRYLIYIGYA